jgi:hypothetical protein
MRCRRISSLSDYLAGVLSSAIWIAGACRAEEIIPQTMRARALRQAKLLPARIRILGISKEKATCLLRRGSVPAILMPRSSIPQAIAPVRALPGRDDRRAGWTALPIELTFLRIMMADAQVL